MNTIKAIKAEINKIQKDMELCESGLGFQLLEDDLWNAQCRLDLALYQQRMGMVVMA